MKRKISLLFITLLVVASLIACTSEGEESNEVNITQEEIPKDNGQSNQSLVAKEDTEYNGDNPEIFELDNGLTFSVQKEKQDDNWSYIITGYYQEKGYEMKKLNIRIGNDSWYVAEPSLYLEEDLKKQPFVIESEEPLSSIDYSMAYASKFGEEELDKAFNFQ
ncbi:hypothetical protein GCM10011351_31130 [Paraliobacillus quinghaiensis]|uniref:Uncharacterized protein n=1 Tax=Paraliobacillus quinghaiensis TaxID=470815 RepID=A0A917TYN0_9BACI|nr:hypothetical protein [Paraliobacillus quinghaiensis]GGM42957.1 hypothetical protein GCM10011351_31130 [Paraliobacillus quinghaiensis]